MTKIHRIVGCMGLASSRLKRLSIYILALLVGISSFTFSNPAFAASPANTQVYLHVVRNNKSPRVLDLGTFVCYAAGGGKATPLGVIATSMIVGVNRTGDPTVRLSKPLPNPPLTGVVSYKGTVKQATLKRRGSPSQTGASVYASFGMKGNAPHVVTGQGFVNIVNEGYLPLRDPTGKTTFQVTCPAIEDDEDEEEITSNVLQHLQSGASTGLDAAAAILIGILGGLSGQGQPSF